MPMPNQTRLDAVRVRRESLHQAMVGFEDALTTPTGDVERWRLRVTMAVDHAINRIAEHIEAVEAPDGFFDQIASDAPRLICHVDRLKDEHDELTDQLSGLRQALVEMDPTHLSDRETSLHRRTLDLLSLLSRHRQRGADLIYEAYQVDIGDSH